MPREKHNSEEGLHQPSMLQKASPNLTPWNEIAPYAWISLISFLCGASLVVLIVWKADKLAALGLTGPLYYLVLLPLGLSAAGFLFGTLRSYARYRGRAFGGVLEMGGPAVIFVLVVIGGFLLPPPQTPFAITVFVHGKAGLSDLVLRNSGYVYLDLGPDRRKQQIGEQGEAHFSGIPPSFHNQEVQVWVEAPDFESAPTNQKYRLATDSLYVTVQKKPGRLLGHVQDPDGNPIDGAEVHAASQSAVTDQLGGFDLVIPGERMSEGLDLDAVAPGYSSVRYKVVPNTNVTVVLKRKR